MEFIRLTPEVLSNILLGNVCESSTGMLVKKEVVIDGQNVTIEIHTSCDNNIYWIIKNHSHGKTKDNRVTRMCIDIIGKTDEELVKMLQERDTFSKECCVVGAPLTNYLMILMVEDTETLQQLLPAQPLSYIKETVQDFINMMMKQDITAQQYRTAVIDLICALSW